MPKAGLLCFGCNTRLGWYEKLRQRIDAYITGYSERIN